MKEQVTKFDLEAAFKALDELEAPAVRGLKPNRLNISESVKRVDKTELLLEDYYDVNDDSDLQKASDEREAEVAKAKLARIEKIVDLDAETEEDIQPSYVGKTIVQCPQCMTLYYRKPEDLVAAEDDQSVVNVGEQCPNCGHADGFTVIGKVAAEEQAPAQEPAPVEEPAPEAAQEEAQTEEPVAEEPATEEPAAEEPTAEEAPASEEEPSLEPVDLEEPAEEEEKKNESLEVCEKCGKSPCECVETEEKKPLTEDADLNAALDAHNEYIKYLQTQIEGEEKELSVAKNEEVKASIQRKIDGLKADLEAALPDAVKADVQTEELPAADEIPEKSAEEPSETSAEEPQEETKESLKEDCDGSIDEKVCTVNKGINHTEGEAKDLNEASESEIDALFDSKEFQTPISDAEVRGYFADAKVKQEDFHQDSLDAKDEFERVIHAKEGFDLVDAEEIDEESLNEQMSKYFTDVYQNVESFKMTDCEFNGGKLIVEGLINFASGKQRPTKFEFSQSEGNVLEGINEDLAEGKAFKLSCDYAGKTLMTESISYDYRINEAKISGTTK